MQNAALYLMTLFYVMAGIYHFINPAFYKSIMPPFLPHPMMLIYVSGICEIVFGILLIPPVTRPMAAWLIIALLVAIYPANIYMAVNFHSRNHPLLWIAFVRLPLQFLLIWWAWQYT